MYEEILEKMETPEGKAIMNKIAEEYIKQEKIKSEKIKNIISDTAYIEWLKQFAQDKDKFFSDDWVYTQKKLSEVERENISKLYLFYEGISQYASQNYILPLPCEFGNFYRIKLDDYYFKVGVLVGQGTVFFFNKETLNNRKEFIDFNDVMAQVNQDKSKSLIKKQ